MKNYTKYIIYFAILIVTIFAFKQCNNTPEPTIKTEKTTTIDIEQIKDSILKSIVVPEPTIKYLYKYITKKGKDSIVYKADTVDHAPTPIIQVKEFDAKVNSNDAKADLKIMTTGDILKVTGFITYPKEKITNTITKTITETKNNSGLFLYAETSVNRRFERKELGFDYVFKNTIITGLSVSRSHQTNYVNLKIGIRIN